MNAYYILKKQYRNPVVKTMGIYTITNFFGKGLSFLLLPLFSNPKYLTPADNGLLSLFGQAILFVLPFINLGILKSAGVDYFKLDEKKFKDFCTTGFAISVVMTLIAFLCFFIFGSFLFFHFSFPPLFIWAIPLTAFLAFCYEFVITLIRNRDEATKYMQVNSIKIIIELGLALCLIVGLAWGWLGRVTGMLAAGVCIAAYGIYFLIKNNYLFGAIRKKIIYTELKYSVPVITMEISIFCLFSSDSFMLSGLTKDNAKVGIYGMACVFGSIILTLCIALIQYMIPKINEALSKPIIAYADIKKQFSIFMIIMLFAYILFAFCVPVAYHLFINERYWKGISYYYFLSAGYLFWAITFFLYTFLFYFKQKKKLFMLAILSITISLTNNYFFIKKMGSMGAAISVCCSYFIVLLLAIFFTRSFWKHVYPFKKDKKIIKAVQLF